MFKLNTYIPIQAWLQLPQPGLTWVATQSWLEGKCPCIVSTGDKLPVSFPEASFGICVFFVWKETASFCKLPCKRGRTSLPQPLMFIKLFVKLLSFVIIAPHIGLRTLIPNLFR